MIFKSPSFIFAVLIVIIITAVVFIAKKKLIPNKFNSSYLSQIKALLHQIVEWTSNSSQDNDPVIGLIHANYAVSTIYSLRALMKDDEINEVGNIMSINIVDLQAHAIDIQNQRVEAIKSKTNEQVATQQKAFARSIPNEREPIQRGPVQQQQPPLGPSVQQTTEEQKKTLFEFDPSKRSSLSEDD
jgi:hypothetical protein